MRQGLLRFAKYTSISGTTFIGDVAILFLFIDVFNMHYLLATGLAFVIAVSINYLITRRYVFSKTTRAFHHGYIAFLSIAGFGMVSVLSLMTLFVEVLQWNYIVSRVLIACVIGTINYLLNLFFNFKVVGEH
jgi:putative flippase GtrA